MPSTKNWIFFIQNLHMTVNIEFPSDHHSECVFAFAFYFQHLWVFRQKQIMMEIRRDNFTIIKLKFRKQRKWTKQISFLFCRIESDKIRWPFIRGRQILRYLWSNTINIVCFGGFFVPLGNLSTILRRHHYRWRATHVNLNSAHMAIEQWRFFYAG